MILCAIFTSILLSVTFARAEVNRDCFATHLDEAMALNLERRALYGEISGGESFAISDKLIRLERFAKFGNTLLGFDRQARKFQDAGVPVLCDEFIPMVQTPAFTPLQPKPWPVLTEFSPLDSALLSRKLRSALRDGGFPGAAAAAEQEIAALSSEKGFHCMTRHVLESIVRIANLAKDPSARLSRKMLISHIWMIPEATKLDEAAAPLQARGIAILCQDVPPIPAH